LDRRPRADGLEVVAADGELRRSLLVFRDWLRASPAGATEYVALKQRLAAASDDPAAYRRDKAPFIRGTQEAANVHRLAADPGAEPADFAAAELGYGDPTARTIPMARTAPTSPAITTTHRRRSRPRLSQRADPARSGAVRWARAVTRCSARATRSITRPTV
jgi:hypothetical protein